MDTQDFKKIDNKIAEGIIPERVIPAQKVRYDVDDYTRRINNMKAVIQKNNEKAQERIEGIKTETNALNLVQQEKIDELQPILDNLLKIGLTPDPVDDAPVEKTLQDNEVTP